ncbi:hypothetical protein COB28_00505 [Candidatus Dependentiae bacterium]|nr:MAG: hypothetical protein COB28_00505 [Candidatus Dependentiae bacterium]
MIKKILCLLLIIFSCKTLPVRADSFNQFISGSGLFLFLFDGYKDYKEFKNIEESNQLNSVDLSEKEKSLTRATSEFVRYYMKKMSKKPFGLSHVGLGLMASSAVKLQLPGHNDANVTQAGHDEIVRKLKAEEANLQAQLKESKKLEENHNQTLQDKIDLEQIELDLNTKREEYRVLLENIQTRQKENNILLTRLGYDFSNVDCPPLPPRATHDDQGHGSSLLNSRERKLLEEKSELEKKIKDESKLYKATKEQLTRSFRSITKQMQANKKLNKELQELKKIKDESVDSLGGKDLPVNVSSSPPPPPPQPKSTAKKNQKASPQPNVAPSPKPNIGGMAGMVSAGQENRKNQPEKKKKKAKKFLTEQGFFNDSGEIKEKKKLTKEVYQAINKEAAYSPEIIAFLTDKQKKQYDEFEKKSKPMSSQEAQNQEIQEQGEKKQKKPSTIVQAIEKMEEFKIGAGGALSDDKCQLIKAIQDKSIRQELIRLLGIYHRACYTKYLIKNMQGTDTLFGKVDEAMQKITARRATLETPEDEETDSSWDEWDDDDTQNLPKILDEVCKSFALVSQEDQKGFNEVLESMQSSVTASMSISRSMAESMLPLSKKDKANLDQFLQSINYKKGDEITNKIVESCFETSRKNRKNFCNYISEVKKSSLIKMVNKKIKDEKWKLSDWQ